VLGHFGPAVGAPAADVEERDQGEDDGEDDHEDRCDDHLGLVLCLDVEHRGVLLEDDGPPRGNWRVRREDGGVAARSDRIAATAAPGRHAPGRSKIDDTTGVVFADRTRFESVSVSPSPARTQGLGTKPVSAANRPDAAITLFPEKTIASREKALGWATNDEIAPDSPTAGDAPTVCPRLAASLRPASTQSRIDRENPRATA